MTLEIADGIINLIKQRSSDLEVLEIEWFGGEPLLAIDRIEYIQKAILEIQSKMVKPFRLTCKMTTNGYFLHFENAMKLLRLGITYYQISLDGFKDVHDLTRKQLNGKGSFEMIAANLVSLKRINRDFHVLLRLHYTEENWQSLPDLIEFLNDEFSDDSRFNYFLRSIGRWGGVNDEFLPIVTSSARRLEIERYLYSLFSNQRLTRGCEIKTAHSTEQIPVCYAATSNSFVVRSNGDIVKCTIALNNDLNKVGRIDKEGHVHLDNYKAIRWLRGTLSGDLDFMKCPLGSVTESNNNRI
jgi:uncharacterized protein